MIAGPARVHGLTVAARNEGDFTQFLWLSFTVPLAPDWSEMVGIRRFDCGDLGHHVQRFLIAAVRRFFFQPLEFEQASSNTEAMRSSTE